jgi:hypothetical protein
MQHTFLGHVTCRLQTAGAIRLCTCPLALKGHSEIMDKHKCPSASHMVLAHETSALHELSTHGMVFQHLHAAHM